MCSCASTCGHALRTANSIHAHARECTSGGRIGVVGDRSRVSTMAPSSAKSSCNPRNQHQHQSVSPEPLTYGPNPSLSAHVQRLFKRRLRGGGERHSHAEPRYSTPPSGCQNSAAWSVRLRRRRGKGEGVSSTSRTSVEGRGPSGTWGLTPFLPTHVLAAADMLSRCFELSSLWTLGVLSQWSAFQS